MTIRIARWCFSSLAAVGLLAAASQASAQCVPGSLFCAQVNVGGTVSVGGYVDVAPPPPPPPVIVAPPPPPPVVIYQPPPAPPPPPPVFYQPPPMYPPPIYMQPPMRQPRDRRFGLHLDLGYMGTDRIQMAGADFGPRFRPSPFIGVDLGIGMYGGQDYNLNGRVEFPLTLNVLFYFNPQSPVQVYALLGTGVSWAHVDGGGFGLGQDYTYWGGQVGLGLEFRVASWLGLNLDARGFLRTRVDGGPTPEFTDSATGQTTNTSMGIYATLGASIYF